MKSGDTGLMQLYGDAAVVTFIKVRWAGHVIRMANDYFPKKHSLGRNLRKKKKRKTKVTMHG